MIRIIRKKVVFALMALIALAIAGSAFFAETTGTGTITPTTGGASGGGIANVTFATTGLPSWTPIAGATGGITPGDLYNIDSTGTTPYTGDVHIALYLQNADSLVSAYTNFGQTVSITMLASQVTNEAVGTGNGTQTVFLAANAPVAPTTLVVRVGGVAKTEGTDYTVNYKTGQITFTSAPANGAAVTADYWYNNPTSGTQYKPAPTSAGKKQPGEYLTLIDAAVTFVIAGDSGGAKYRVRVDNGSFYCFSTSGTLSPTYNLAVTQAS